MRFQQKDGQEGDDDDEQRKEQRRSNLLCSVDQNLPALRLRNRRRIRLLPLGEMPIAVLHHHNRGIDKNTDSQSDAAKGHDVRRNTEEIDRDKRDKNRDRQSKNGDQRGTEVKQEDDDDEADNDGLFEQIALESGYRIVDEAGTIIARDNLHSGWKRRRDISELLLYPFDDIQRIHTLPHDDDAANSLSLTVPLGDAFSNVRAKGHAAEITQQNRSSVFAAHGDRLKIIERLQVAEAANHVLRSAQIEHPATYFVRARLHPVDDHRERDVVGQQLVRIEPYLVLLHIPANARNLRDAGNGL